VSVGTKPIMLQETFTANVLRPFESSWLVESPLLCALVCYTSQKGHCCTEPKI